LAAYGAPLRPTKPQRPNSIPALHLAANLEEGERARFSDAVFDALWQEQADISEAAVLTQCLTKSGASADVLDRAFEGSARTDVAERTAKAYALGVFGVPTFALGNEFFSAMTGSISCFGPLKSKARTRKGTESRRPAD
jgi:predicted DsbA family dithiol-disulfide isomerase